MNKFQALQAPVWDILEVLCNIFQSFHKKKLNLEKEELLEKYFDYLFDNNYNDGEIYYKEKLEIINVEMEKGGKGRYKEDGI